MGNYKNRKPCPVPIEEFEYYALAAAPYLFKDCWAEWTKKEKYTDVIGKPEEICKFCRMSAPTFRKRAKRHLMPEKFGENEPEFYSLAPKLNPTKAEELRSFD